MQEKNDDDSKKTAKKQISPKIDIEMEAVAKQSMSIKRLVEDDDNLAEAADVPDMEIQNQQGYKLEVLGQQLDGSNNTPPDDVIEKALGKIPPASQDIEKPKRPTALRDITLQIP